MSAVQDTDTELLALCREFEARNARIDEIDASIDGLPATDPRHVEAYEAIRLLVDRGWEIRERLALLPAHTSEGIAAKARIALWETCDGVPEVGPCEGSDTKVAWSLAKDVLREGREMNTTQLDANIIALCEEHIANHAAFNVSAGLIEPADDPLWHAYMKTHNAVSDAKPQTMAEMAAKARAAKVEAMQPDGEELLHGGEAAEWAWDLVNDLLRLQDQNPDAELLAACTEYLRREREFEAAYVAYDGDKLPSDHPAWDLLDLIPALTEKIVALQATTVEGIAARARCMAFTFMPHHPDCQDDPDEAAEERFRAAILRDCVRLEQGA